MFLGATSFNKPLNSWNMASVINTNGASLPAHLQPSSHPPSAPASPCFRLVCACAAMFLGATSFNQDISSWNMTSVKDTTGASLPAPLQPYSHPPSASASPCFRLVCACAGMFQGATSFNQDISSWDLSSNAFCPYMFTDTPGSTCTIAGDCKSISCPA